MWQIIILKTLFYLSILGLLYIYAGYPLLMFVLLKLKRKKKINKKNITPFISLVIAAYNEEGSIRTKLDNVLSLDYPREQMEIVVVSDASTDKTDKIVQEFSGRGIKLHRLENRGGKIAAYRQVIPGLKGEILVFSDATSILNKDSLTNLISNFNDPSVGCVGGLLTYINSGNKMVGEGESIYWKYEKQIRQMESRLSSLTSVSGTLYAIRSKLYPLEIKDYLADDLIVCLAVKKKGLRVVLEEKAICKEIPSLSVREEVPKRARITLQNIRGLIDQSDIMNPFKYGMFSLLVLSHKVGRLSVPLFLLSMLLSSFILSFTLSLFKLIFILQVLFYLGALAGYLLRIKSGIVISLFFFCLSNVAILVGIIKFLAGRKAATWEPVRTHS